MEDFQREAKVALEGARMPSTGKLKQLIDQGQTLGVELSECKPLKWVTHYYHIVQLFVTAVFTNHSCPLLSF